MILGCIADDFTGAGDIASILARAGMRTSLITRLDAVAEPDCEAGVIALKIRSIPPDEAVRQSIEALDYLRAAGCEQIYFKYCSTFDSTPQGNIGPVAEALAAVLEARTVVVCPSFPANGRTVYQGNMFVDEVPLAESGMRDHPLTPMRDSDIRRLLAIQSRGSVSHVGHGVVRRGSAAIANALRDLTGLVVVDAIDDNDLLAIAEAVAGAPLVTGGSALAQGLAYNFAGIELRGTEDSSASFNSGPAAVISGSCSTATIAQVEHYRAHHPAYLVPVERLLSSSGVYEEAMEFAQINSANAPLIYSTMIPGARTRTAFGEISAAEAIESLMGRLARGLVDDGFTRIVVAGGETSGAVITALGVGSLEVGPSIAPGVPVLYHGPLSLALKSGNFGQEDFFSRAVAMLEGAR